MSRFLTVPALVAAVFSGCSKPKETQPAAVAADTAAPVAAIQDTIRQDSIAKATARADSAKCGSADSVKCVAAVDSAARAAKAKAKSKGADTLLRDSAFGPKFTVDSNGKITPIKPPPPPPKRP